MPNSEKITIGVNVLDLPKLQVLCQLVEDMGVALQDFGSLAYESVEYGDWPEMQAHVAHSETLIARAIAFAEPDVPVTD